MKAKYKNHSLIEKIPLNRIKSFSPGPDKEKEIPIVTMLKVENLNLAQKPMINMSRC